MRMHWKPAALTSSQLSQCYASRISRADNRRQLLFILLIHFTINIENRHHRNPRQQNSAHKSTERYCHRDSCWRFAVIRYSESLEELLRRYTRSRVDGQFHLTDLLVNLLHEMNDEINQFVFVHLLRVEVCNQKADIVTLRTTCTHTSVQHIWTMSAYSLAILAPSCNWLIDCFTAHQHRKVISAKKRY